MHGDRRGAKDHHVRKRCLRGDHLQHRGESSLRHRAGRANRLWRGRLIYFMGCLRSRGQRCVLSKRNMAAVGAGVRGENVLRLDAT